MSIAITHVRFGSTKKTEDEIVSYRWKNEQTGKTGQSTKTAMVEWIDINKGAAYVGTGSSHVMVTVVRPQGVQPYLRTHADGKWTNNLLHLPTFE